MSKFTAKTKVSQYIVPISGLWQCLISHCEPWTYTCIEDSLQHRLNVRRNTNSYDIVAFKPWYRNINLFLDFAGNVFSDSKQTMVRTRVENIDSFGADKMYNKRSKISPINSELYRDIVECQNQDPEPVSRGMVEETINSIKIVER